MAWQESDHIVLMLTSSQTSGQLQSNGIEVVAARSKCYPLSRKLKIKSEYCDEIDETFKNIHNGETGKICQICWMLKSHCPTNLQEEL